MTYCSPRIVFDSCVKTEKLTVFPYGQDILGNVVFWLSDDIVRFKVEVGVKEKCTKM